MKILSCIVEEIEKHARKEFPNECCGILLAEEAGGVVNKVLGAENTAENNSEFEYKLGYKTHIEAVKLESDRKMRIAGYYHSHPNGKVKPSLKDKNRAINKMIYLIMAVSKNQVRHAAWKAEGKTFIHEYIEIIN